MGYPPGAFMAIYGGIIAFVVLMALIIVGSFALLFGIKWLVTVVKYTIYLLTVALVIILFMVVI